MKTTGWNSAGTHVRFYIKAEIGKRTNTGRGTLSAYAVGTMLLWTANQTRISVTLPWKPRCCTTMSKEHHSLHDYLVVISLFALVYVLSRRLVAVQCTAHHNGCRSTGRIPAVHSKDNRRLESRTQRDTKGIGTAAERKRINCPQRLLCMRQMELSLHC